ncbi:D-2-hydroxyacid dehydrogenase [Butyrivibrio sp. LB2008]|uniref:D-2-hydroxyacid dehydrogenase n=1 Tax=Butyrivibrio sp. LB2008 TaxID=1408305 RepID=UPI00047B0533|nr:D-2-hydroxyacid dehydrogenase [Butyrivibrio sp. LB2008]
MKVIVYNNALKSQHKNLIKETAEQVGADVCFIESEDSIPEEFEDAEIFYGPGLKTIGKSKHIKWFCAPSAGVDFLLKPGVFANEECIITNSAGAYGVSIAEHIVMLSLMLMRQMHVFFRKSISCEWGKPLPQKSLKDCRITVLGTGDIGSSFARRAKAFEPKSTVGVCRSGKCSESSFDKIYRIDEFNEVLRETELLVMCLPGTTETEGVLSKERMDILPQGAYIVNVGRGSAIDESALIENLENEKLAGAALDVFVNEPLPEESPLWTTKNLIITPHVAGNLTLDYTLDKNVEMFCENLVNYAEGRPLKHVVDKVRGY